MASYFSSEITYLRKNLKPLLESDFCLFYVTKKTARLDKY